MRKAIVLFFLFALAQEFYAQNTIRVMSYNLLRFPEALPVNREDTLAKILKNFKVDVLGVSELVTKEGSDKILNKALNTGGVKYKAASFVPATRGDLQQMLYYNSDRMALYSQDTIQSNTRDFNKYTLYPITTDLVTGDTIFIDFYVCHLKAGQSAFNATTRAKNVGYLLSYLNNEKTLRNRVLMGDLNLYTDQETAYKLLTKGVEPYFQDPLNQEGVWHNNYIYKDVFTQSTRSDQLYGEGAGGGVDDRFDFILASGNLLDSSSALYYKKNSYKAIGNDGNCFNKNITDCLGNSNLLSSLYYMSDHLPVIAEFELANTDFIQLSEVHKSLSRAWFCENALLQVKLENASTVIVFNAQGQMLWRTSTSQKEHSINLGSNRVETIYFLLFPETGERVKVAL